MIKTDRLDNLLKSYEWMHNATGFAECRKKSGGWDGTFTSMQRSVLGKNEFWEPDRNIVIHGPTSSGKTFLAELAALHQIMDPSINEHKVLFLVPLRVLVTSHCRQFRDDFSNVRLGDKALRIYESSADYQDHDEEIMSGDYDIAVVVYEKFFLC